MEPQTGQTIARFFMMEMQELNTPDPDKPEKRNCEPRMHTFGNSVYIRVYPWLTKRDFLFSTIKNT